MNEKLKSLDTKLNFMNEHRRGVHSKDKGEARYVNKQVNSLKYQLSKAATEFLRMADQNEKIRG